MVLVDQPEDYHLDLDPNLLTPTASGDLLKQLLDQLVEAAGGQAGVMTTRLTPELEVETCLCGVTWEECRRLITLMTALVEASSGVTQGGLAEVEREARSRSEGRPLAIPVRSGGRSVGVLCLWHPAEAPSLMQESPGLVHLSLDKLEMGLQGARLLERLLHERKLLEAVVQHSTDGVVIHDPQGRVIGYNLTMARLSGWKIGEAVGEMSHEAFPLVLMESTSHVFDPQQPGPTQSVAVPGTVPWLTATDPVEAYLLSRSGQRAEVEVIGAPLFDRQGKPLGWVMTVRDISRRKEMERLHKLFLSAVSHELQTPIAIIRGYAGLMADPEVNTRPEAVREQAQVIVEESVRLEQMVQQMLYATRIQAGGLRLQKEELELGPWLKKVAEKMGPVLKNKDSKLVLGELPAGLFVRADGEKLQQVVTNLLENASKYASRKPVRLQLRQDGNTRVRVEVCDQGPGIPKEERERIFSAFERGGDPLKQRVRGAGLGLYICKAIVEAHSGKLGVEANPEGGAVFYFTLPREK